MPGLHKTQPNRERAANTETYRVTEVDYINSYFSFNLTDLHDSGIICVTHIRLTSRQNNKQIN